MVNVPSWGMGTIWFITLNALFLYMDEHFHRFKIYKLNPRNRQRGKPRLGKERLRKK